MNWNSRSKEIIDQHILTTTCLRFPPQERCEPTVQDRGRHSTPGILLSDILMTTAWVERGVDQRAKMREEEFRRVFLIEWWFDEERKSERERDWLIWEWKRERKWENDCERWCDDSIQFSPFLFFFLLLFFSFLDWMMISWRKKEWKRERMIDF